MFIFMRHMFWVDLEMTGLDEIKERIIEVAVLITDLDFNVLEQYHQIVYQPQSFLDNMNTWCKETHGKSGLTTAVKDGLPIEKVEKDLIDLSAKYFGGGERIVLCGNSVNMDKRFIDRYMPQLAKKIHYRVVDVTSFKEIFRSKYNVGFDKKEGHRALDDIKESIAELKHYLQFVNATSK